MEIGFGFERKTLYFNCIVFVSARTRKFIVLVGARTHNYIVLVSARTRKYIVLVSARTHNYIVLVSARTRKFIVLVGARTHNYIVLVSARTRSYTAFCWEYEDTSNSSFEAIGPQVVHTLTQLMYLCHYKINHCYYYYHLLMLVVLTNNGSKCVILFVLSFVSPNVSD